MVKNEGEKRLAYHEAGHIVVGRALGLQTWGVSIGRDERNAGLADIPVDFASVYDFDEGRDYVKRQLVCYLAGAIAEELLTGEAVEFRPGGAYTSDWNGAADCIGELAGGDEAAQLEVAGWAFDKAKEVLRDNWTTVEKLADALLRHRTLSDEEVARITEGASHAQH